MASAILAAGSSLVAITINKCSHINTRQQFIANFGNTSYLSDIFVKNHPKTQKSVGCKVMCKLEVDSNQNFEVSSAMTVGDLVKDFKLKCLEYTCLGGEESPNYMQTLCETATTKAINPFEILMAGGRAYPPKKSDSNAKQKLYNDILLMHQQEGLKFPKAEANTTGDYIIQVLTNALWYVTNDIGTIMEASTKEMVKPFPTVFQQFGERDDYKAKKMKKRPMTSTELHSHAQALFSIAMRPVMNSTQAWLKQHNMITELAECLESYSSYLNKKNLEMKKNQQLNHPVRQIAENTTAEFRKAVKNLHPRYVKLDEAMRNTESFLFFDETMYLLEPFANNMQRHRFFENLHLSIPVDIFRFSPGGSSITTVCLVKVLDENRTVPDILTQCARFMASAEVKNTFKEYHTRFQRRQFKDRLSNIASVRPAVADLIYKELALDASATRNEIMSQRMQLIFLGNDGLIQDLRQLNPGRPGNMFDTFFTEMAKVVEEATVADERRHNEAHLATWISLRDLIDQCTSRCPEGTMVPSATLVQLQFSPRNPYSKAALSFTSKLKVQYKIQRRQLRTTHPDQHYAAAQFKYLRELAVDLTKEKAILLFADDKAKIPIGEPGHAVSTGVRGKKTLTPSSTELVALDHDMNMSSLTPSVLLLCETPPVIDQSFVRGRVVTTVNDSVFESSSPWRHSATIGKLLSNASQKTLILFTDGGTDHRHTLESVRLALICLFIELDLDMVIAGRCAPGQSFTNPAERVMSVLNLGLQNCSLERSEMDSDSERVAKKCNAMKSLREHQEISPQWLESVEGVKRIIANRFRRLRWNDQPVEVLDSIPEDDIIILQRHARSLFPSLDLTKVNKATTSKCQAYLDWKAVHCRERHYTLQIKKCDDRNCCLPKSENCPKHWLPDPVLEDGGEHYKSYSEVKGLETVDGRPSLSVGTKTKVVAAKVAKVAAKVAKVAAKVAKVSESQCDESDSEGNDFSGIPMSAQTARAVTECTECRKPRVVYSRQKITTERQKTALVLAMSEYDFTCGSPFLPADHVLATS